MASLADLLRQGADKLVNLPTEAQRFVTNPQAFIQLLTGKNALPRETGFAASATGLPAQQGTVLDPNYQAYMQGYEQGEPFGYAAMATPAVMPVAKALAPKAGMMAENYMVNQGFMPSLIAYHGTPHTIKGKFDISKVGTGEGAQAYGHGMYFAENPAVAKQYATDRSYVGKVMAGTPDNTPWDAQRIAQDTLNVHGDNAIAQLQSTLKANSQLKNPKQVEANKQLEDAIDILKTNQLQPTGNLYKVDIPDADIPFMLDYDKPLSQQPKAVQNALAKYDSDLYSPKGNDYDSNELGQSIYQRIVQDNVQKFGLGGNSKRASEDLNALGIKGIRYYDEGSRQAGGTSNFVVFDPSNVKILEQNSKPMTRKEILEQELKKVVE
jgi:hypothetical protein